MNLTASKEPLYISLIQKIEDEISSGSFKFGDKMYAVGEMCRKYDVSTTTAVRCINVLKEKGILKSIPRKGTFVQYKPFGKSSERDIEKIKTITVYRPELRREQVYFPSIIYESILKESQKNGLSLKIEDIPGENISGIPAPPIEVAPDEGIIVICGNPSSLLQQLLAQKGIRRVLVDSFLPTTPCVITDNASGIKQLLEFLKHEGHRTVGLVQSYTHIPNIVNENERCEAFKSFSKQFGIKGEIYKFMTNEEIVNNLGNKNSPSALMFTRDDPAIEFIDFAQKKGLNIPDDLSVTGFDDCSLYGANINALTTVRVNREEMGNLAAKCIINFCKNTEISCKWLRSPCSLQIRKTVKYNKKGS